jgi:hypothetical protein
MRTGTSRSLLSLTSSCGPRFPNRAAGTAFFGSINTHCSNENRSFIRRIGLPGRQRYPLTTPCPGLPDHPATAEIRLAAAGNRELVGDGITEPAFLPAQRGPPGPDRAVDLVRADLGRPVDRGPIRTGEVAVAADPIRRNPHVGGRKAPALPRAESWAAMLPPWGKQSRAGLSPRSRDFWSQQFRCSLLGQTGTYRCRRLFRQHSSSESPRSWPRAASASAQLRNPARYLGTLAGLERRISAFAARWR